MNTYKITWLSVDGVFRTRKVTGKYPETALQAWAQWISVVGDTVFAPKPGEVPVVEWESSVM